MWTRDSYKLEVSKIEEECEVVDLVLMVEWVADCNGIERCIDFLDFDLLSAIERAIVIRHFDSTNFQNAPRIFQIESLRDGGFRNRVIQAHELSIKAVRKRVDGIDSLAAFLRMITMIWFSGFQI